MNSKKLFVLAVGIGLSAVFALRSLLFPSGPASLSEPAPEASHRAQSQSQPSLKNEPQIARAPASISAAPLTEAKETSPQDDSPIPRFKFSQPAQPTRFFFENEAQLLLSSTRADGADGHSMRTSILKTEFKYPLLRIQERLEKDEKTGQMRAVARSAMVADHAVVMLREGYGEDDLRRFVEEKGFSIRNSMPFSKAFLVAFKPDSVDSLEQAIAVLKKSEIIEIAEPDLIASIR